METLGKFVQTLATEVRMAIYYNIDDVVAFVNWLDEELSLLVIFWPLKLNMLFFQNFLLDFEFCNIYFFHDHFTID